MATILPHGARSIRPHPAASAKAARSTRKTQAKCKMAGMKPIGGMGPFAQGPCIQGPKRPERKALAKASPTIPVNRAKAA